MVVGLVIVPEVVVVVTTYVVVELDTGPACCDKCAYFCQFFFFLLLLILETQLKWNHQDFHGKWSDYQDGLSFVFSILQECKRE